jgi:hypothetical protein
MAVGAGSVAYHGPGGAAGRWAHDASLVALSGVIAVADAQGLRGTTARPSAFAAVWAVAAATTTPRTSPVAQAVAAAVATGAELAHRRAPGPAGDGGDGGDGRDEPAPGRFRRRDALAAALLAAGLALQVAGRTGGPLCRPGSRLQPHAAWHALSAAALWLAARPA